VTFFTNYTNIALIVIALVSGALLLWPAISRRGRGGISAAEATTLINRRNAVIVDLRPAAEFAKGTSAAGTKRRIDGASSKNRPDRKE
jgi:hypothetical protein